MAITGTLVDHGQVKGTPLHRQDKRTGAAPTHTVVLPRFGVEAPDCARWPIGYGGPVFANREDEWISLATLRRTLRAALPEDLRWTRRLLPADGGHCGS